MSLSAPTNLSVFSTVREASMRLAIVRYDTKAFAARMPRATSEPMAKRRDRKRNRFPVPASLRSRSGPRRLSSTRGRVSLESMPPPPGPVSCFPGVSARERSARPAFQAPKGIGFHPILDPAFISFVPRSVECTEVVRGGVCGIAQSPRADAPLGHYISLDAEFCPTGPFFRPILPADDRQEAGGRSPALRQGESTEVGQRPRLVLWLMISPIPREKAMNIRVPLEPFVLAVLLALGGPAAGQSGGPRTLPELKADVQERADRHAYPVSELEP